MGFAASSKIIAVPLDAGLLAHCRCGFFPVIGFPGRDGPAYRVESVPGAALFGVDAPLLLLGALLEHDEFLHTNFPLLQNCIVVYKKEDVNQKTAMLSSLHRICGEKYQMTFELICPRRIGPI